MIYEYLHHDEIDKYKSNLNLFKYDLDIIIRNNFKIYIAIDFYDIFSYCFPYSEVFTKGSKGRKRFGNDFYRDQISRSTMFLMLEHLYQKPNALLPSYMIECDEFISNMERHISNLMLLEPMKLQKNGIGDEISRIIGDSEKSQDFDKLVNYFNRGSPALIYYYSRGFANGLTIFNHLLKTNLNINLKNLIGDDAMEFNSLIDYHDKEQMAKYNEIRSLVEKVRQDGTKVVQNERDAEAIYTTIRLNEIYNKDKKAFILISSAPNLSRLMSLNKGKGIQVKMGADEFSILRGIDFFLTALMGISNHLNYSINKVSLMELNIKELYLSICSDSEKLEEFSVYEGSIGGDLLNEIRHEHARNIKKLNEKMNNINLALLTDEFLPHDVADGVNANHLINFNDKLYNNLQKEAVRSIQRAFHNKTFTNKLFMQNMELERIRIEFFMNAVQSNEKSLQVILFSITLRLNINDSRARIIIDDIVKENIKGRLELRQYGMNNLPDKTADRIYSLLRDLAKLAIETENKERYILWQLIFLYLGRIDHVDHLYDMFFNSFSEKEQKEFSYLYAINFIRKMRTIKLAEPKGFLKILDLCEKNNMIRQGTIEKLSDLELITTSNRILIEYDKDFARLSEKAKKIKINDNMIAIYDYSSNFENIYIFERRGDAIKYYYIDLRFVHLGSVIFNRYLNDFGCTNRDYINRIKDRFDKVFMPIAEHLDPEFNIIIVSDYAYLLSSDQGHVHYASNLLKALGLMINLQKKSKQTDDIYWGYVRNYILGYVYYRISENCHQEDQKGNIENALIYFKESSDELPQLANYLRDMVEEKIKICQRKLEQGFEISQG